METTAPVSEQVAAIIAQTWRLSQVSWDHPGMDRKWFHEGVRRAYQNGCRMEQTPELAKRRAVYVTSGSQDGLVYLVTRTSCTCKGHLYTGRCQHRALAIWEMEKVRDERMQAAKAAAFAAA